MRNRDRLFVQPLGSSRRLALIASYKRTSPGKRLAEIDDSNADQFGWLTRLRNGTYVLEQHNGAVRVVDQRKAEAALRSLASNADD